MSKPSGMVTPPIMQPTTEPPKLRHKERAAPVAAHTYSCARALFRPISTHQNDIVKPPVQTLIGKGPR
jgi:hypothetical protein